MNNDLDNPRDETLSKFWGIFFDSNVEECYLNKKYKRKFLLFTINLISFFYSIFNLAICLENDGESMVIGPLFCSIVLILIILLLYCSISNKDNFKVKNLLAYLQNFLISTSNLVFIINHKSLQANENHSEHLFNFKNINYIFAFTCSDILIKQIWIILPFNNFFYFFSSNICFCIMLYIILAVASFNLEFNDILSLIFYLLFLCSLTYLSRKIMINEKKKFVNNWQFNNRNILRKNLYSNINTGYIKIYKYEIEEKNNFFDDERDYFKKILKEKEEITKQQENLTKLKGTFNTFNPRILNTVNIKEELETEDKKNKFTHVELGEILKYILLNSELKLKFQLPFHNFIKNYEEKFSRKLEENNSSKLPINDLENSTSNFLNITLQNKPAAYSEKNENSKICFENVLEYFYSNHSSFKNFISIGKIKINQEASKILSLEILVRVNNYIYDESESEKFPKKYIEFIFNDTTKNDVSSTLKNLLIKTGQYLHDFKNPLICIQSEISELKEETEVLMAKLCQQNEFIDNLKKSPHSKPQQIGILNKNFDISLDECLQILEKFEYAKEMSEYCQTMIGSYEDFSKSIFSPQSLTVSFQIFDLIKFLNFIENFTRIQINRLNKNLNFHIFLENFELENGSYRNEKEKEIYGLGGAAMPYTLEYFTSKKIELNLNSDESKLKRVILNIISNSIKFTHCGLITLTLKKEISYGRINYNFSIKDTGIGMSESDLKKLFTPFFSNNNSDMNKCGVGLGLINVKEITEKLGGGLRVTSKINEGTTMSFSIEDKSAKIFESTEENSLVIIRTVKNSSNFDEINKSHYNEEDEQHTFEITNHICMIDDKIKMNELHDLNSKFTDCELYSSFNSNQDSFRKEKTVSKYSKCSKYSHPEIILNSHHHNNNEYLCNIKRNVNSNYLIPFTHLSQAIKRTNTFNIVNSSNRDSSSKSSNNVLKSQNINMISNRSSRLSLHYSHSKLFFDKLNLLTHSNNFTNLNCVLEITYEILSSAKKSVDSPGQFANSYRYGSNKYKSFDDEIFLKRVMDKKKSSINMNHSIFKRNSVFYENSVPLEDSLKLSDNKKLLNVLIIDDEKSIRSFYKNNLKKISENQNFNFLIEEADDGSDGLTKILSKILKDREIFDFIITDDSMTLIDGAHLFNIIYFISQNEQYQLDKSANLIDKFIICSSDVERVKSKVKLFGNKIFDNNKNLILCEKPLKLEVLKSLMILDS